MLNYNYVSEQAVQLEKASEWNKALIMWRKAEELAKNRSNKLWAEIRGNFCEIMKERLNSEWKLQHQSKINN